MKNNRGAALIIAIFSIALIYVVALEVSRLSLVEYSVSSKSVNNLRAYYAAKAGMRLGLLRVLLYKQALHSLKQADPEQIKAQKQYLDMIWNMPMGWPPPELPEMTQMQKDEMKTLSKESFMRANYSIDIQSEGSKIDINALAHPVASIAKATREQVLKIFNDELENNDEFSEKYSDKNFEELVFNLTDWIDEDRDSLNGGDEGNLYRAVNNEFIPPNEPFKTLQELRMVEGMDDELFNLLKNRVTVFGINGINVNTAKAEVLQSIDPQIDEEIAKRIVQHINDLNNPEGGPFSDLDDFKSYLESGEIGINTDDSVFNTQKIPLYFVEELNFRITSYGEYGKVQKEIQVITYDFDSVQKNLTSALVEEEKQKNPDTTGTDDSGATTDTGGSGDSSNPSETADTNKKDNKSNKEKTQPPTGKPRIVFWSET